MICFILSLPISNRGRNDIPFRSWRWSILRPPWSFLAAWSRQVLHGSQTLAHADGEQYQYSLCFVKMKDLYIVYIYINPFQYGVCHLGWLLCIGAIRMNHMNPFAARLCDAQKNDDQVSVSYPWAKSWNIWLEFASLARRIYVGLSPYQDYYMYFLLFF